MLRSGVHHPFVIDRIADTTSHRERGALDGAIVQMLVEFLDARSIVLYQLLQEDSVTRMMRRAGYERGRLQMPSRAAHDSANLPALADRPEWRACVDKRRPVPGVKVGGGPIICFPIEEGASVTGVLEIELRDSISARDTRLVEGVLRILRNLIALIDYGERDTLTGVLNRKSFEARFAQTSGDLPEVIASAAQPVSWLGLVDIDRFKSINDTYGHVIGDEVLLLISQIMQRTLRGGDQLFRFGGEEFVVVLEDTHAVGADIAFERIRAAVAGYRFPQVGTVTVSLGYTAIRRREVPASCLERADAALYFVKHNGRNGVGCCERLVESGAIKLKDNAGDVELF